jgi:hypothetical protein
MAGELCVVIPMYNSAATVAEAIDSVLAQTFDQWRLVVVNDGSTDHGPSIVEQYMARDARIRMVTQANRGLAGARNTGIETAFASGATYLHFLDADDWMHPRAYEWLVPAAGETGGSYGGYELCDEHGRSLGRQSPMSVTVSGLDEELEWNRAATHARLFSAEMINDQRFDESLKVVEDYDFWLRLAVRGKRWKGVEQIVCGYRLRPTSMSKNFAAMAGAVQSAVEMGFREAQAVGWTGKIDLSDRRLTRICGNNAMLYATMEALLDPMPNKAKAVRLLESGRVLERYTPAQAAQAASTALLFGACTAPDVDGWAERRWLMPLRQWWVRCAEEGWMSYNDVDACLVELSRKIVHPDMIVDTMLDSADRSGLAREHGLVIVGAEKNGRRLARNASARGWQVLMLDDFSDDREIACLGNLEGCRLERDPAKFSSAMADGFRNAPVVCGLIGEGGTMVMEKALSLAERSPKVRMTWHNHRELIGSRCLTRMRQAMATPIAKAG